MRILAGIACYGSKNEEYLYRLLREYASMTFDVDVVVFSNIPRQLGPGVEVIVGLPAEDPHTLPFAHQAVFAERSNEYDLFVYSEDDMLITEEHVRSFLWATELLPADLIAGFVRIERRSPDKKTYVDINQGYHWEPGSAEVYGGEVFAYLSNEHAAAYVLTREQLRTAIASGNYLVPPHRGLYSYRCTAATDPYTQCGFRKVVCVSRLERFELHHLPNAYLGELGIDEDAAKVMTTALIDVAEQRRSRAELVRRPDAGGVASAPGGYCEPRQDELVALVPRDARRILALGTSSGETELAIVATGATCTCIPVDSVTAALAESKGLEVVSPDIDEALASLGGERFDCVLLGTLVQHVPDPSGLVGRLRPFLVEGGCIVGAVPNGDCVDELLPQRFRKVDSYFIRSYTPADALSSIARIALRSLKRGVALSGPRFQNGRITRANLRAWLRDNGVDPVKIDYVRLDLSQRRRALAHGPIAPLVAGTLLFVGRVVGEQAMASD